MEPLKEDIHPLKDEKRPSKVVRVTLNGEMKVLEEELSKKLMQPQTEVVLSMDEEEDVHPSIGETRPLKVVSLTLDGDMKVLEEEPSKKQMQSQTEVVLSLNEEEKNIKDK